jgi:hypothetical protein
MRGNLSLTAGKRANLVEFVKKLAGKRVDEDRLVDVRRDWRGGAD